MLSWETFWEIYDRIFKSNKTVEPVTLTLEIPAGSEEKVAETLTMMIEELRASRETRILGTEGKGSGEAEVLGAEGKVTTSNEEWIVRRAFEDKRLIDVEVMRKVRPPRLGDKCTSTNGVVTIPGGAHWEDCVIVDITSSGEKIRMVFGDPKDALRHTVAYKISEYGLNWKYKD